MHIHDTTNPNPRLANKVAPGSPIPACEHFSLSIAERVFSMGCVLLAGVVFATVRLVGSGYFIFREDMCPARLKHTRQSSTTALEQVQDTHLPVLTPRHT